MARSKHKVRSVKKSKSKLNQAKDVRIYKKRSETNRSVFSVINDHRFLAGCKFGLLHLLADWLHNAVSK